MNSSLALAVSYALADSVNALLIGVIVALGLMLAPGRYARVVPLLVFGDWAGVLSCAVVVMFVLDGVRDQVQALLASPIMGWLLIGLGVLAAVMTWRSRPGQSHAVIDRLLGPLREPSLKTFAVGWVLGAVQSLTSGPFFVGLFHLAAGDFSAAVRYGGLVIYASLALSLPAAVAVFIGVVRSFPNSAAGRIFAAARRNSAAVARIGGYIVAVFLAVMGAASLVGLH